jgi:hypothetical protein
MRWRKGETVGWGAFMMVLLSWTRPIASAHNIGARVIDVNQPSPLGDYRASGLVLRLVAAL